MSLSFENILVAEKIRNNMLTWSKIDDLLYSVFSEYRKNVNLNNVGFKIVILDKLYNCNLKMDINKIAEHIINKKIDMKLISGDPISLVDNIANIKIDVERKQKYSELKKIIKKRVGLVFTSKYCHFHEPERFPIYDSFAKIGLGSLLEKDINEYNWKYENFKNDIDDLLNKNRLNISYKQIDEYLWLYGKWINYKNNVSNLSGEIKYAIENYINLFEKLDP